MSSPVQRFTVDAVRAAGIVGAGGAGFPAYVKLEADADTILGNGAECEPLLHKDANIMEQWAGDVVRGMSLAIDATGAKRGIVGIKEKNSHAVDAMAAVIESEPTISLKLFGDYYPAGDEFELVHSCTGRLIPPGGLPIHVGCVVNNVETLFNIAKAADGTPMTHKFVTVGGAVAEPVTVRVPLGISIGDAIDLAGGATADELVIGFSGLMMGRTTTDLSQPVTKTCAGLIVLPADHRLSMRKLLPIEAKNRIGKSACDQCRLCTELCPRYLLGHAVEPHQVMRSLGFTQSVKANWNKWADLCCSCGLCTLYSCPEDLFPKEACDSAKDALRAEEIPKWTGPTDEIEPHGMKDGRRVPVSSLSRRLGVTKYEHPAPWSDREIVPNRVALPLNQHVGMPATAVVDVGEKVTMGQMVAQVPADKLGVAIHASIDGTVRATEPDVVIERS